MASSRVACTIVAKNYMAFARTLCASYLEHHPEDRFFVLVVDETRGFIDPAEERFALIRGEELGIPHYKRMAFKYNITELSTAVKPWLLEKLIREHGAREVLYLDPDILVTRRLDPLYDALGRADIVLTPHLDADFPDDGLRPNDGHILQSGMYNLGFIGVNAGENAARFLRWWQGKLYDKCVIDYGAGYFVDQRYIDLVPFFFDGVFVERGPGFNVAYWNLHSRRLARDGRAWTCNGEPLSFFHFSGIDVAERMCISRHLSRYNLENRPDLAPLLEEYRARVLANGHVRCSAWPYSYATFRGGVPIHAEFRRLYRTMAPRWRQPCFDVEDPFASRELLKFHERWHLDFTRSPRRYPRLLARAAKRRLTGVVRRIWAEGEGPGRGPSALGLTGPRGVEGAHR